MKTDTKLQIIYIIMTMNCMGMVSWTFLLNFKHDEFRKMPQSGFLPFDNLSKYDGHTLAQMAHVLPAYFWSMFVPLQFHPGLRKTFPKFHKYLGRAFIYTSYTLMIGVGAILHGGISFENYVNVENDTDPYVVVNIPGTNFSVVDFVICLIAAMFIYTASVAVAYAKKKDYFNHKIWIIRHCSWGIWVMAQRIMLVFLFVPIFIFMYGEEAEFSGRARGLTFAGAAFLAVMLSVGTAEYAISLMKEERRKLKKLK